MALFSPTGGLVYHARALRHRQALWRPFRGAVEAWLSAALPPSDELVLVGPSAGHCLPLEHLARFERVLLLEPDGFARFLLRRRLGVSHVTPRSDDLLVAPLLRGEPGLDQLLQTRPRAALVFCNVLGQLEFGLSGGEHTAWRAAFRRRIWPALAGRPWASFHDRWSMDRAASEPALPVEVRFDRAPSDEQLGAALFGDAGAAVEVLDHGTSDLFPETAPRRFFTWQLTPSALHVVEALGG